MCEHTERPAGEELCSAQGAVPSLCLTEGQPCQIAGSSGRAWVRGPWNAVSACCRALVLVSVRWGVPLWVWSS